MYKVKVPNVFVDSSITKREEIERLERMLANIDFDDLEIISPGKVRRLRRKDLQRRGKGITP